MQNNGSIQHTGGATNSPQQQGGEKAQRVYKDYIDENQQHVKIVANDPYVSTSTPEVTPQHRAQNPCKHFLQGHCNRGTTCRFFHPDEPLQVTLRMGTPRRSPSLGPKISSPGGVTDDGPEPPAMALPPAATSSPSSSSRAAAIVSPRTNDPYKCSPQQKFATRPSSSSPVLVDSVESEEPPHLSSSSAVTSLLSSNGANGHGHAQNGQHQPYAHTVSAASSGVEGNGTPIYMEGMPPRSDLARLPPDGREDDA